jgi:acetyl-CoA carboxylase biotin carboxyl carrier protein
MKQIKELMSAMEKMGIKRLRIKEKEEYEIELERKDEVAHAPHHAPYPHPEPTHRFPAHSTPPYRDHKEEPPKAEEKKSEGRFIASPMVGTLYASPSPDDPPFVKVGDKIDENTVVCIIEAMKVMNEVKAGVAGTIAEILIDNAHPVEFGTKIFRIV